LKSFVKVFGISEGVEDTLEKLRQPLPVPTTAIFSHSDGLLHWRGCVQRIIFETPSPSTAPAQQVWDTASAI